MSGSPSVDNLGASFNSYFEIVPALDDTTRKEVFRVRHSVYCSDLHFEAERSDGEECDEHDAHSVLCLLRTRGSQPKPVGCCRMILTDPKHPAAELPFEHHCAAVLDRSLMDPASLDRHRIAEVSRLAVVSDFRRRKEEQDRPVSISDQDFDQVGGASRFPFIPVGLYLACVAISLRIGIDHLFVLTEPRLAKHFSKIGFDIRQIGGEIEHRGTRVPSHLSPILIQQNLKPMLRPLYEVVKVSVDRGFEAHARNTSK
ncbi:PEP-CTERM/exosortase system-associated acyltransferase [Chitinimonas sp. BJB300]|uniref:PEP-CTERM/exosortase system-associated acyltransferase n=1 Tax=Chitinimonas sp. BJB300 TaxID=1559339 RepID=UPI000C11247F|nr:PEP-CTERM/exosortase system-associated acyltransferase [Chitinimonas sp. BJB300]PHV12130.1 GNAT family N-acetyltransferase [Chitinimonas sp. BJB300]TSJ89043.1 PEP-CTERM/exosortase system-associated acyltransferase [Chitinimonas sp. BJB300]